MKTATKKPKKSGHVDITLSEPSVWKVCVKIVANDPDFVPKYQSEGAACADMVANLDSNIQEGVSVEMQDGEKIIRIFPQQTVKIDCGFCISLPDGWEAQIRARSGLALKGLACSNGPGTIDADYRGPVSMMLTNTGKSIQVIKHKQRIGQIALKPVYLFDFQEVTELSGSKRGTGGFGSTGENV